MRSNLCRIVPILVGIALVSTTSVFSRSENVAPRGTASQSSTVFGGAFGGRADTAIDGNTSGDNGAQEVSHTDFNDAAPSWQVDLGAEYSIDTVALWNRTDCCGERLTNFVVSVLDAGGNETFSEGFFADGTGSPDPTAGGFEIAVGARGSVVRIELLDTHATFDPEQYFLSLAEVQVFAGGIFPTDVNVAPIGTATQSSTGFGGNAEKGNDGNTDGNFGGGSVTHTASGDAAPSWEVDLGMTVTMTGIVLWNRTGCCPHRLTNLMVQVLDAERAEVWSEVFFPDGVEFPDTLDRGFEIPLPDDTAGQIVRVERLGPDSDGAMWLSLAEVQVFVDPSDLPILITQQPQGGRVYVGTCSFEFSVTLADETGVSFQWQKDGIDIDGATGTTLTLVDIEASDAGSYTFIASKDALDITSDTAELLVPGTNLAVEGTASQSSTGFGGAASRGNDGNINGNYGGGSVTHTGDNEPDAFWEVELFGDSTIDDIVLWNRTDCCATRLSNIAVVVLAADRSEVFSAALFTDGTSPETPSVEVAVPEGTVGRIVRVERLGLSADNSNWLSLAEVEVFGDGPLPPESPNLTQACNVTATQSSDFGSGQFPASLGIDGNLGNFTHTTGSDDNATWEVDLGRSVDIGGIILHNRTSCCGSRLRDVTVSILDGEGDDGGAVLFESELLNPENTLGAFPDGPPSLTVDVKELTGDVVNGRIVRVRRAPDADLSGSGGQGNNDEANVLSLGEVEIFAEFATPQISADCNQDGAVNAADISCLVNLLFSGFNLLDRSPPPDMPCSTDGGNLAVLDVSGNQVIDVADIVGLANFLFNGGPPPPGGTTCRPVVEVLGCPENAGCQ